jgi:hypothetical protein
MSNLTPEGLRLVSEIAARHGVGVEAALGVLGSLALSGGTQAQFSHPDLGGMGQWSQGGMIMVGDMFNSGLKYRVDALCNDLAGLLRSQQPFQAEAKSYQSQSQGNGGVSLFVSGAGTNGAWWPADLGDPASTGAQNDLRYAWFPASRRVAIQRDGEVRVYDSGDHSISGFSQQQGGDRSLTFTSQFGTVRLSELALVSPRNEPAAAPRPAAPPPAQPAPPPAWSGGPAAAPLSSSGATGPASGSAQAMEEIVKTIERLAELRQKNILTEEEFSAKKAELLGRL